MYRFRVNVDVDGRAQLRAYRLGPDGNASLQVNVMDYRGSAPRLLPVVTFEEAAQDILLEAYLTSIDARDTPRPTGLVLEFTLDGARLKADINTTYHYRVCGAVV